MTELNGKSACLDMVLNGKQREALRALRDPSFQYYIFDGGIRSGKTELMFAWLVARAIAYPGSKQIVIRKERAQHKRGFWGAAGTVGRYMRKCFDDNGLKTLYQMYNTDLKLVFWNGSEIRCEGVDTVENFGRILGDEYITMWFNEAVHQDFKTIEGIWDRAVQLCDVQPDIANSAHAWFPDTANKQILFDTNPKGKRHWLYKFGVLKVDPNEGGILPYADRICRIGGWKPWDNEANVNTDGMDNKTGTARRRQIDGEWCDTEGAVYEEFNEDTHVCRMCDGKRCQRVFGARRGQVKARKLFRSIDFGWNDPTVCLWGADVGGQIVVYRCYYSNKQIMQEHAKAVLKMQEEYEPISWTVADHQPEFRQQFKKNGIPNRNAHKDSPLMGGVDRVKQRLHCKGDVPGLLVCQHATPVIEEFSGYMMAKGKDEPEDDNNHCMDSVRYMVAEIDGKTKSKAFIF